MFSGFIVFQAYGNKDILHEVLISISSILRFSSSAKFQLVIYTDSKDYLKKWLPEGIMFVDTPLTKWEEWKGEQRFVHRAKIEMLRDFVARNEGNVLYCDTDTYFLESPEKLFSDIANGELIMHMDEGQLKDSENLVFRKLEKFLKGYKRHVIPASTHMWNAGVLGFKSSDRELLDKVLALSDSLHAAYPKHVMEQLAFSVCFQVRGRRSCEDTIFHYWDFKDYRRVLSSFFEENGGQPYKVWSSKIAEILPMDLRESMKNKTKPSFWKRIFG